jgi:hypothetical protein
MRSGSNGGNSGGRGGRSDEVMHKQIERERRSLQVLQYISTQSTSMPIHGRASESNVLHLCMQIVEV